MQSEFKKNFFHIV